MIDPHENPLSAEEMFALQASFAANSVMAYTEFAERVKAISNPRARGFLTTFARGIDKYFPQLVLGPGGEALAFPGFAHRIRELTPAEVRWLVGLLLVPKLTSFASVFRKETRSSAPDAEMVTQIVAHFQRVFADPSFDASPYTRQMATDDPEVQSAQLLSSQDEIHSILELPSFRVKHPGDVMARLGRLQFLWHNVGKLALAESLDFLRAQNQGQGCVGGVVAILGFVGIVFDYLIS